MGRRLVGIAGPKSGDGGGVAQPADQPAGVGPLGLSPPRVGLVGEQGTPDQGQTRRGGGPGPSDGPRLEPAVGLARVVGDGVEIEPVEGEAVAGIAPPDPIGADDSAQAADEHRDLIGRQGWWLIDPQAVDQRVQGDGMAVVQGEDLEQGAGLAPAESGGLAALHLDIAEEPDPQVLHGHDLARPVPPPVGRAIMVEAKGRRPPWRRRVSAAGIRRDAGCRAPRPAGSRRTHRSRHWRTRRSPASR